MKMRLQKDKFYDTKKVSRFPGNKIQIMWEVIKLNSSFVLFKLCKIDLNSFI